jgi:hypothetical protein
MPGQPQSTGSDPAFIKQLHSWTKRQHQRARELDAAGLLCEECVSWGHGSATTLQVLLDNNAATVVSTNVARLHAVAENDCSVYCVWTSPGGLITRWYIQQGNHQEDISVPFCLTPWRHHTLW